MTPPFNFSPWLNDGGFNWGDHRPGAPVPFYSPNNFGSPIRRLSSSTPRAPSANHSGSSFMVSTERNFGSPDNPCHSRPDNTCHSRPDNFTLPMGEWKSPPISQHLGSFRMDPQQAKSFENYRPPLLSSPVIPKGFLDFSPLPGCGSSMRRFSCSPVSNDSGYSDCSRSFDSPHSLFSAKSPLQFVTETELQKPDIRGMKRKADEEDLHISPPCQPTPKRKRVDCLQSNGNRRLGMPASPVLPYPCVSPSMESLCVTPLQGDLDVIFRSIIEVFLCYSDFGSLSTTRNALVSEMKTTSACYSKNNLANSERRQDFSRWQTRWGYMYMYMMRHAHLVFHSLKQIHLSTSKTLPPPITYNNWNIPLDQGGLHTGVFLQKCHQPGGILTICAIGGGPGSDLIGLALFLRANRFPVKIRAHIFDKCMDWEKSWRALFQQLPPYIADYFDSVTYTPFDYLSVTISNSQAEIIRKSDLVTIVKSLSAVSLKLFQTKNVNRGSSLFEVLSTVTTGCMVLYLDNKAGTPGKVFQRAVKRIPGYQYAMMYYEVSQVGLPSDGFSIASRHFMDWVSYGPSFSSGTNEIVALAKKWLVEF